MFHIPAMSGNAFRRFLVHEKMPRHTEAVRPVSPVSEVHEKMPRHAEAVRPVSLVSDA